MIVDMLLLAVAGFCAGVVNAIAGGGTFITFPALVLTGVPPITANATSAVAVFPGYLSGALGFREEIGSLDRSRLWRLTAITLAGGLGGALLLLVSSETAFAIIVPFLLLFATLAFLFGDRIRAWAAHRGITLKDGGALPLFLVCVYGGYFNGGLGIVMLALFALWGWRDIHQMNGVKNGLSFVLSAISVLAFATAGLVLWPQAAVMMVFNILGGYSGARAARIVPAGVIRGLIAVIGFGMSGVFFLRALSA